MSGLTGYLTLDGTDLSYVFHPINKRIFTNAITTDLGIKGPITNITYNSNMIGNITTTSQSTQSTYTSGTIKNILTFSLTPGLYLCAINTSNFYSASNGILNSIYLGISSSSSAPSTDGFWVKILSDIILPNHANNRWITSALSRTLMVTATTTFYLIQTLTFSTVTINNNEKGGVSYFRSVRIG